MPTGMHSRKLLAVVALAACGGSSATVEQPGSGAAARVDAGPPSPVYARAEGRFAPLTPGMLVDPATTDATDLSLATAAWPLEGAVSFQTTPEGVDLSLTLTQCRKPYAYPVFIYPGTDCSQLDGRSKPWDGTRGTLSSKAFCFGPAGALFDTRPTRSNLPWTIGGPASSNLLGRAVAIHDPDTNLPLVCATISAAEGGKLAAAAAPVARPPNLVTAQLAGLCVLGPGAFGQGTCPNLDTLADCALTHCVASCLDVCSEYVSCLGGAGSACSAQCQPSPGCASCLGTSTQCMLGFCQDELACAPAPTPGGPCTALRACCARQGALVESCNHYADLVERLSGDASCLGALSDWDVNTHYTYRSPCYPKNE